MNQEKGDRTDDDRVSDVLLRWESARRDGVHLSPDALCEECQELVDLVTKRIRSVMTMEQVLGVAASDPSNSQSPTQPFHVKPAIQQRLPHIPGYEILDCVDEGGMGVVFKARQIALGRIVAIKMIAGVRSSPKLSARFRTEAEATAKLQHPNIVQIFEVGDAGGRPYYSMEFVDGGTLAQHTAHERLSAKEAARLVETLARAMHAAHERGIIHRDLKPSNVMLTANGAPKIADFGLAKRIDEASRHTQTGEILGTPSYMAPEQAQGNKDAVGPLTDVYALGAIFYELLSGRAPFEAATAMDTIMQVVRDETKPPSLLNPKTPRDAETICMKCLEKKPEDRYASANELADDLRRFLDGDSVIARRAGLIGRSWKWLKRRPVWIAVGLMVLALVFIPVFFLISNYHQQQQIVDRAHEVAPQVREILMRNCYECHGLDPKSAEKNLNILDHDQLLSSSRNYIVPGSPEESRLIQRIEDGSMPPEPDEIDYPRVTQKELDILEDWIRGGAPAFVAPAEPTPPVVPYSPLAAKVKTIFVDYCHECHKFDVAKGGIKILHHRLLLHVRKVVVPGDPDDSELYKLITTSDPQLQMPPKDYDRLPPADVATIRRWIAGGAPAFSKSK